jgi:hypothetical protein
LEIGKAVMVESRAGYPSIWTSAADKISGNPWTWVETIRPIEQQLESPLFADGGGAGSGDGTTAAGGRIYRPTSATMTCKGMQVKTFKLEVVGTEEVTVPAGTFTAYKVEITSAEGDPGSRTLWVATDGTRRMVKMKAIIPQMNGAVMTSELQ